MKRNKMTVLCIVLALALLATSIFMVSCKDPQPEKQDAIIYADSVQSFIYDGQPHNVVATLNHNETELKYDPAQGYTEKGEYEITVSADETENYKAKSITVTLKITDAPPKSTYELWDDFTGELKKAFALEGKDKLKVNIQANAKVKNSGVTTVYALDVMGNIDLSQTQNNSTLFHAVISADGNNMGVYYQDNAMYLEIGDQLFKLKNSDLTALLTSNVSELSTASDMSGLLSLLPVILFRDEEDIKYNDGVYELTIDVPSIWQLVNSDLVKKFIKDIISEENMELFDGFFAENEIQFEFAVDLSDEDNAFANVKVENGVATLGAFEIAGGSYDYVTGKLDDEKIQAASEINLANISVVGNIDLLDRVGHDYEHLTYKLVADIEPFALINAIKTNPTNWMNDEAVKKMKLYFSLYHVHTPGEGGVICTDVMCPTRVGGQDDTSILDIAFDPQNFGDGRLYVAANLSRVFSDSSFSTTLRNILGLAGLIQSQVADIKTQNFLTAIDLSLLVSESSDDPSDEAPGDSFKFDAKTMLDPLISIVTTCLKVDDGSITLNVPQTYNLLNQAFDLDSLVNFALDVLGTQYVINTTSFANAVVNGVLSPDDTADTDQQFNALRISVADVKLGSVSDFDCKDAILHLPTDPTAERSFGGHKPLAFENANPKATGRVFNTKESVGNIFTAESGIHLAIDELDKIIGKNIEYTYTALDGQTYTAKSQLVAINGLDENKLNQKQTVTAIVLPLDGQGGLFSDGLWSVLNKLHGSVVGSFLPEHIAIPFRGATIEMDIYLTEVSSYELTVDNEISGKFELTPYSMDPNAKLDMSQYMTGTLTLIYADGYSCDVKITATSEDLLEGKYLVNDGNDYSFTFSYPLVGEVETVNVNAVDPEKPSIILKDNGGISVATYAASSSDLKLKVELKTSKTTSAKVIDPSLYRVLLNDTLLEDIDLAADGRHLFELAQSGADVRVEFKKDAAAISTAYVYFRLEYEDGSQSDAALYATTYSKLAQGAVWSTFSGIDNLGSNLDGKLTYNYWKDTDDEFAPVRKLTLKFKDGKYYLVDNADAPTVEIEVTITATGYTLENGLLTEQDYKMLHYDSAKKTTKTPSVSIAASFEVEGVPVNVSKTVTLAKKYNIAYVKFSSTLASETTFDDLIKFEVTDGQGNLHDMRLTYVGDGKYVLRDTFEGDKLNDIDVEVKANIYVSSSVLGDPIELTDGKLGAENIGKKVTLTFVFSYDGMDFSASNIIYNKTVN